MGRGVARFRSGQPPCRQRGNDGDSMTSRVVPSYPHSGIFPSAFGLVGLTGQCLATRSLLRGFNPEIPGFDCKATMRDSGETVLPAAVDLSKVWSCTVVPPA
jgi:hypothetical protein